MSKHPSPHRHEPEKKPTKAAHASKREPIIRIEKVGVTYFPGRSNEVKALQDINLEIYPGEYIIFFGPSGCGKSTLLYSIAGLERNIEGDIWVKDKNLAEMHVDQVEEYHQRIVGMIFQSYYLIPSLTVADNVALPQVAISGNKEDRQKKAVELLEKFGVGAQAKKLPTELSGGQQQRVAICRSLMNNPDVLVGDEPVGNLDSKSSEDVMNLLRYLNDVQKKTVILVTHDPSHLHHAHRVFYLRDGRITATKTNTEEERKQSPVALAASQTEDLTKHMAHWIRAYAQKPGSAKAHVAIGEVQHILAETLTGMTVEELVHIETKLYDIILRGSQRGETIYKYLTKPLKKGGIGMSKAKAKALSHEFLTLAHKVKHLRALNEVPEESGQHDEDDLPLTALHARELRRILLESLDIHLHGLKAVAALDVVIQKRLEAKTNLAHVQQALMHKARKGGVGLSPELARKVARRLESFILYKPGDNPSPAPNETH